MDPALLSDPHFWTGRAPVSAGSFPGSLPTESALAGQVLFQTSGSSGQPKWIALSREALLLSAAAVNHHLEVDTGACWGLALPIHHVGGFGVACRAFEAACRLAVFPQRWDATAFTAWVAAQKVTHTSLVPTQVHDLVAANRQAPNGLRAIVVGGGRLSEATGTAARELGWPVLASYGMTESASQIATEAPAARHLPWTGNQIPLLPIWDAACDPQGLLRIAGPALFSGHLEQNGTAWQFVPREGKWHFTRDRVALDAHKITPLGRADSLVKVLGELVDPEALERELAVRAPEIFIDGRFAIVAVPDPRAGHRLVPVIETPQKEASARAAVAAFNRDAPGFQRLATPVWVQELPRSPLGKLLRSRIALPD